MIILILRTYVTEGYQGTLGFGFPNGLGLQAANPGRAVVSLYGDGGFMFGVRAWRMDTPIGLRNTLDLPFGRGAAFMAYELDWGAEMPLRRLRCAGPTLRCSLPT